VQIKDDALWHELVKELKSTEQGPPFHDFVTQWCERAEQLLAQNTVTDPADALRLTLANTEENLERKNVWIVGQALVVIIMHWAHGDDTANSLTEVEMRLVEDVTAAKIAQMQEMAEEGNKPPE
jgi:transcriptional regulatory protein LevR